MANRESSSACGVCDDENKISKINYIYLGFNSVEKKHDVPISQRPLSVAFGTRPIYGRNWKIPPKTDCVNVKIVNSVIVQTFQSVSAWWAHNFDFRPAIVVRCSSTSVGSFDHNAYRTTCTHSTSVSGVATAFASNCCRTPRPCIRRQSIAPSSLRHRAFCIRSPRHHQIYTTDLCRCWYPCGFFYLKLEIEWF